MPAAVEPAPPEEHLGVDVLFVRHGAFVQRFLARMGVPAQDLEDVVQEVFLIAHRQGGYVFKGARATTWLAEIALRLALALRRTRHARPTSPEAEMERVAAPGPSPFDSLAASQSLERVQRALGDLDLEHRAIFVLFELEGESCDAIAESLGVPLGTVHSRLHYARKAFRKSYDRLAIVSRPQPAHARGGAL